MNIINKLTLRQLMLNKKRTLVTIIGSIISAAMITAVATLGFSFMDLMQRQQIAIGGEWHAVFKNVNLSQLEIIGTDKQIKTVMMGKELGYAYLKGSRNTNKPYLYINEYSSEWYSHNPVHLKQGRLPQKPDELVISEEVLTNAKVDYKIGDVISLSVGSRQSPGVDTSQTALGQFNSLIREDNKVAESLTDHLQRTYTIVGIMERPGWEMAWSPGYNSLSYIGKDSVSYGDTFDTSVIFHKINNGIFNKTESIAAKAGAAEVGFNTDLLRYYGVIKDDRVKNMIYTLTAIVMFIVVIGSVSLIYNAFAISVSERSRYLGMLSSVGATKRQKRNSVFFEGAVIGSISIPIGIAAGYAGLAITYLFINPVIKNALNVAVGFRSVIFPVSLLIAISVSIATILISTYIPARRASNVSAIDAIRQVSDIKINAKQVRTLWLTRKLFGIEGDLGLKNLKRNKGRYKATVFSLVISIVLFMVVSYFTDSIRKTYGMTQEGVNFDVRVSVDGENAAQNQEIINKIISLSNISEVTKLNTFNTSARIPENSIADYLEDARAGLLADGTYPYEIRIDVLDDEALKSYAEAVGAGINELEDTSRPSAIVIDTIRFKDNEADKYVETKAVKAKSGDLLDLSTLDLNTGSTIQLKPVTIAALTDLMPMGVMSLGKTAGFHMIMSKEAFAAMIEGNEDAVTAGINTEINMNSPNPLKLQEQLEQLQNTYGYSSMIIFNKYQYKQQETQSLLLVSVFTYAFIILITAICIANIINTISTSITLRKREFAMLKSIGITPKGFNRLLRYESIFYGIKALVYGLPVSILVMYLQYHLLSMEFQYRFTVSIGSILTVIAAVFVIVGTSMLYSSRKVKKENIIDALKQEII